MNFLRRFGLVFVSCIILLLALLCPVSAVSFYDENFTIEGTLDNGIMLSPSANGVAAVLVSEPNYPYFNPNDIPWRDSPDYVKSVLSLNLSDFNKPGNPLYFETPVKVPFVCVRVNGSNAMVYVGYNISVVYTSDNSRVFIGRFLYRGFNPDDSTDVKMLSSTLYRATYNLSDMSLSTPWYDASAELTLWDEGFDGKEHVYAYTGALTSSTGKYDLYFYGSNYAFSDASLRKSTISIPKNDSSSSPDATVALSYPLGFENDSIFFANQTAYTNTYCKYFKPTIYPQTNTGVVGDYSDAESNLMNGYNPGDISSDLSISIDSSSWEAVFSIFNLFITSNGVIVTLIITMLSLGFVALLLNR